MRVCFYTLGCKVNQYETEVLSARFAAEGFDVVPGHAPGCDVYVVGSCTVTAEGDRKTRQAVRRFRRENPGAIVVLTGCYPQAFPREAAAVQEADIITGARNRAALPQLVKDFSLDHQRVVNIPKHEKGEDFDPTKHDAILHKPDPQAEKETVDTVVEAGYRIGDRVIRAARVVVASPQS